MRLAGCRLPQWFDLAYTCRMYPILYRWYFFIYSYTALLALGLAAAIALTARLARRMPAPGWPDGLLAALLTAVVGGRIAFVWWQLDYFALHPQEVWQVWRGGLSYHGALLAGLAALWLWTRAGRRSFGRYAGLLAPGLALGSAFGWLACYAEGCGHGREALPGLLTADLPDAFGVLAMRYQTQLLGFALALLACATAVWLLRRWSPTAVFWYTLAALSLGRLLTGLLRGDPVPLLAGVRLDIWLDATLAISALILLQWTRTARQPGTGDANPITRDRQH